MELHCVTLTFISSGTLENILLCHTTEPQGNYRVPVQWFRRVKKTYASKILKIKIKTIDNINICTNNLTFQHNIILIYIIIVH